MLTIGQLARCHGLTTKTLRHYDSIGLFCPAVTGRDNGYRYYRHDQIATLGRIVWLRQLGMSLEAIAALAKNGALDDSQSLRESLAHHSRQLQAEIRQRQILLEELTRYLATPERTETTMQTPHRIDCPAQRIIGMTWTPEDAGSIADMWQRFIPREHEIDRLAQPAGTFGICQPLADGQWRYIAGLPVADDAPVPEGMVEIVIPAGHYAKVEHCGPVSGLPDTFRAAYAEWLPAAGLTPLDEIEFEYCGERFYGPHHPESVVELYLPITG